MKFRYQYRTSDNAVHDGIVAATDRDAAFAALKAQGVRPSRLEELPGFFNKLFGKGKRWLAIAALALALVFALFVGRARTPAAPQADPVLDAPARRQVIGDAALIEKGIRNGWSDVFELEGERFLASFAIPGVPAGQRSTTEEEIRKALAARPSRRSPQSLEERQIQSMVEGMKDELRRYLAAGGSIVGYGQRLVARQEQEIAYYKMVKAEIDAAAKNGLADEELETLWDKRNAELRQMGIRLVPYPESK